MTIRVDLDKLENLIAGALREQWYKIYNDLPLSWVNQETQNKTYRDIPDCAHVVVEDILKISD